jgi:hypothetical protein
MSLHPYEGRWYFGMKIVKKKKTRIGIFFGKKMKIEKKILKKRNI